MLLDHCPWSIAGPILGAVIVGLRATLNKPLGALGGYIDVTLQRMLAARKNVEAHMSASAAAGL